MPNTTKTKAKVAKIESLTVRILLRIKAQMQAAKNPKTVATRNEAITLPISRLILGESPL